MQVTGFGVSPVICILGPAAVGMPALTAEGHASSVTPARSAASGQPTAARSSDTQIRTREAPQPAHPLTAGRAGLATQTPRRSSVRARHRRPAKNTDRRAERSGGYVHAVTP